MRHLILTAAMLVAVPFAGVNAAADYLLELDGLKGEVTSGGSASGSAARPTVTVIDDIAPSPRNAPSEAALTGRVGEAFILDGSRSADDGTIRTFAWKQVSGPVARLANPAGASVSVVPPSAGTYVFELSVSDAAGLSSVAQRVTVAVTDDAPPVGASSGGTGAGIAATPKPQSGSADVFLEIEGVRGESAKGEEPSASSPDVTPPPAEITPDFGILFGGGGEEGIEERRVAVATMLAGALAAERVNVTAVVIRDEAVTTNVRTTLKIFGVIPAVATAVVDIDKSQRVKVKYPWWSFLASGKDEEGLGRQVFSSISNVLKTKHDTVKNSINNVR